jgi:hypothetical protein
MIRELPTQDEFTVEEDGISFALLLDVMYSRTEFSAKTPITQRNVSTVLELTRKYDVRSAASCDHILCRVTLDRTNISKMYARASEYGLQETLEKCRECTEANVYKLAE